MTINLLDRSHRFEIDLVKGILVWQNGFEYCVGILSKPPIQEHLSILQSKEDQESDHQTEETHSFGKGETQNGIWEKLTLEGWVTGITDDQWAEHCSDTWKIFISFCLFSKKKL